MMLSRTLARVATGPVRQALRISTASCVPNNALSKSATESNLGMTFGMQQKLLCGPRFLTSTAPLKKSKGQKSKELKNSAFIYDSNVTHRKITIEEAKAMPLEWYEMPNGVLRNAGIEGSLEAREELLRRNIMAVDNIPWEAAEEKVAEMRAENHKLMGVLSAPYYIGITAALVGGIFSWPLIFHLDSVLWFNENFVTFEMAGEGELDTCLEVGSWAWNWMEPPLGEASFFILCMQFARNSFGNLGWKPYGDWVKDSRARKLTRLYPTYHKQLVEDFAFSHTFHSRH